MRNDETIDQTPLVHTLVSAQRQMHHTTFFATIRPVARPHGNRLSAGAVASAFLLCAWLMACDVWAKLLARSAACEGPHTITWQLLDQLWTLPHGCPGLVVAPGVRFVPGVRKGALPLDLPIPDGTGPLLGLVVIGVVTVVTIIILRWRWRTANDVVALGVCWSGALGHGLPRLAGPGWTFTELELGGVGFGLGDITLVWGALWLVRRVIAELRA